ncbi:hypothetical protein P6F26_05660 [Roseibacterium sp. SDUM158017]|uniref:COG3904 family protein n=1 Tax=Roseicyclus salinarum TaxID=3036773 RepID=UPI002415937F|nr:hypothetical protein [Roseibacterium sp. SDUM158017]MDG4647923.1 hypothetical protein [Roseibacterium sp. SDUM158017]
MKSAALSALLALAFFPANAAELLVLPGQSVVYVMGEITDSDVAQFEGVLTQHSIETVALRGPGGTLTAAYEIGEVIRRNRLTTEIIAGEECASACAIIFFAGSERIIHDGARLGLHLPFLNLSPNNVMTVCEQVTGLVIGANSFADIVRRHYDGDTSTQAERDAQVIVECVGQAYQLGYREAARLSEWLADSGIDPGLLTVLSETPSHDVLWIDEQSASRFRVYSGTGD